LKTIIWYFDYVSPFAYLQSALLRQFEGKAKISYRPVLFAGLLNGWGNIGPVEIAPKRVWTYRHSQFLADQMGIEFQIPPVHPFNPLSVMRLTVGMGAPPDLVHQFFHFIWAEGRNPSDPEEWKALIQEAGIIDADERISDQSVKDGLRSNTDEAISRGVFGVPTLEIEGEMFWGVDGTDFGLAYLEEPAVLEQEKMRRLDTLPFGAVRKGQ
jgi:2-hydroxychromene-2-carboxylate isomerase